MNDYPEGAIKTKAELLAFTEGQNGVLFSVLNGKSYSIVGKSDMEVISFSRGSVIKPGISGFEFFFGQKGDEDHHFFSLRDKNIGSLNGYNRHFVFTDKNLAEKYLETCKTLLPARGKTAYPGKMIHLDMSKSFIEKVFLNE